MKTKREIFEAHYRRYQQAGKKDKGKILDEVAGTTGLNRDHLAHVLASYGKERAGQAGSPACSPEAGAGEAWREIAQVSPSICGSLDARLGGSRAAMR
jgi:hypothetical protein